MNDIEWNRSMSYAIEEVEKKKKEVNNTKLYGHTRDYCIRILNDLIAHFNDQKNWRIQRAQRMQNRE